MTTIIFEKGIFYSDTRATSKFINKDTGKRHEEYRYYYKKIRKIGNFIYAFSGSTILIDDFLNIQKDKLPFRWTKDIGINKYSLTAYKYDVKNNIIHLYDSKMKTIFGITFIWWKKLYSTTNINIWRTTGSGMAFASEALELGLTPVEAIKYASGRDRYTNDEVIVFKQDGNWELV